MAYLMQVDFTLLREPGNKMQQAQSTKERLAFAHARHLLCLQSTRDKGLPESGYKSLRLLHALLSIPTEHLGLKSRKKVADYVGLH